MIAKIIEYSARNKFIIFLLVTFLIVWGLWALKRTPLDAIPDLSDTQVIIFTEWAGRSPDLVEDQITYPITSTLLAAPKVQVVRGFSYLGSSFIYVIFEEGTNIYWARSRVLEYLQAVKSKIPADVNPVLGPDATSVGWGFSYAVTDETGGHDLSQMRSVQDYNIKLALESVEGVSQVASIGGFVKQYQITIDPNRLLAYNLPLPRVLEAIKKSNSDVEGRVLEFSGIEYMVRGRGYIKSIKDLETISVGANGAGTPVFLRDIANIQLGPEIRRGITELDGRGEVAGGIVVIRFGENVLTVIDKVKEKIKKDIEPSLPKGMKIVVTYDRSDLIHRSIDTLKEEILRLSVAVSAVCIVFLFHLPSALVVILTLPIAIIISFICMYYLGVTSNIMSLSGIAIAIGAMVDASIIMVENAHKKIEDWEEQGRQGSRMDVIIDAAKEVGPSLFFSLLVITVGFLPVFTLQSQAGRLFKPLAYTKTFAMLFSSFLAVTLTPVLMTLFIKGKIRPEEKNPISIILHKIYEPVAKLALRFKRTVIVVAVIIMAITAYPFLKLGSEFMPPLYEGTLFYMPVTVPAASISEVTKLLQMQDKILKGIPEVSQVFGKAGRAETATDPAPLEMFETVVNLKPESEWRPGVTVESLKNEMNDALTIPGVANSFTMPIKARIDMLSTGIRTPVGIKVMGSKLEEIERLGLELETLIKDIPGTRSVYAERVTTGYFLDFNIKREEAARYGLTVDDVQEIIQSAVGGMNLTVTVEGRERYPVNVRYSRELRNDVEKLKRILVPVMNNQQATIIGQQTAMGGIRPASMNTVQVPIGELTDIKIVRGPTQIKSEEGLLAAYVYIDFSGRDVGGYVEEAKKKVASLKIPEGYRLEWSGEYEYLVKTHERLKFVIPLTALIIFVLIYFNTKSVTKTMIVLLAVPFSLVGSFWLLYILNYNMSIAVWVGIIALAGLDAETGVVMLLYLELAYERWKKEGKLNGIDDLKEAIMYGAVKRIRPKIMTVSVILAGLVPIMFSHGTGSDVMKRIAAPMVGGVVTSTILELIIYPAIYMIWKSREFKKTE
ncbi:MAG: cation transporter [Nitrospirae bacterium GWC2_46_6]|nr:MAG: cation transporter [Nitrospirae bacterium GWA2_46_11]OGW22985.1 MAG: cation transporter [Nitrospirae bacterium GWC2_46_6]OGW25689.1 MAG: cation transporter [Nitrospirae bacterium GWB2_47_37]HAK88607.1 CusA/CzcA family heavy metal efflux RND transporter [Nitrospiraceae bacterium]HCL81836.1 CusA/CzcA family heavy metal efflux RND transporter [Nitrospiraceae bacterium]